MRKAIRCSSIALIGVVLILTGVQTALAHQDPPGATGTGVTLSLTAYRDAAGTIPVIPGVVTQCETIYYQATIAWAGDPNAAIAGGQLMITLPTSGTPTGTVDATGGTGDVPCLGGETGDEGCVDGVDSYKSELVQFQFDATCPVALADRTATVHWVGGISHTDPHTEADASIGLPLTVDCCESDGLACNGLEFCDPDKVGQFCSGGEVCDESNTGGDGVQHTGTCEAGDPVVCATDDDLCTAPLVCTEPGGECVPEGSDVVCPDLFCNPEICNPGTGVCEPTGNVPDCDDTNACTTDTCNEETDVCDHVDNVTPTCDANCEECDTSTGACVALDPLPDICTPGEEICRTPGFWGTHAGTEKEGHSDDITGAVITRFNDANDPDLTICGAVIASSDDAIQAICASPKGNSDLQLARQLTAAALNCIVSNSGSEDACVVPTGTGGDPCGGTSIAGLWSACNAICDGDAATDVFADDVDLDNDPTTEGVDDVNCIALIDCFNNGFTILPDGSCDDTVLTGCHELPLDENCDEFDFLPAAGSPKECAAARKDCDTIFGPIPGCV